MRNHKTTRHSDHLPHDPEIERCVLGAMLFGRTDPTVKRKHFVGEGRVEIFEAIQSLSDSGKPIDAVLVAREITRKGHALKMGELVKCLDATPNADHLEHYAGELIQLYKRRRMLDAAKWLTEKAYDVTSDVDKCWKKIRESEL